MNRILFITVVLIYHQSSYSQPFPEANNIGKWELMTGMDYEETIQYFPIDLFLANEYSEKEFMFIKKKKNWVQKLSSNSWEKKDLFEPSNMIRISENNLMDQTEIANINYRQFISFVEADSAEGVHEKYLPIKHKEYYSNPEFYFHPVIGIDINQASSYCLWRSRIMNYYAALYDKIVFKPGTPLADSLVYYGGKTFIVGRLPTDIEWKKQAEIIKIELVEMKISVDLIEYFKNDRYHEFQLNQELLSKNNSIQLYNVNIHNPEFKMELPSYIYSFTPNSNGFYNIIGNASEFTQNGNLVGGDFETKKESVLIVKPDELNYDAGFRCVCEVYKNSQSSPRL
jgi:formylglycine-generating enzyme